LEGLGDVVTLVRNGLIGPEALERRDISTRQPPKGQVDSAHMSDPTVQRGEVVLGGPGEVGVNHFFNPAFGNCGLGMDLGIRKELWAKIKIDKNKNKPVYE
jgi:hypothetical protein